MRKHKLFKKFLFQSLYSVKNLAPKLTYTDIRNIRNVALFIIPPYRSSGGLGTIWCVDLVLTNTLGI